MSEEVNPANVQQESQEDFKSTPERPPFSPIVAETNVESEKSGFNGTEIKTELTDINIQNEEISGTQVSENTAQLQSNETTENLPKISDEIVQNSLEVRVKDEPGNEEANAIDYDMPIAKTSAETNDIQGTQLSETEATRLSTTSSTIEDTQTNNADNSKSTNLEETAAKSALDLYLDGTVTPIAPVRPRLRVKTEFAFISQAPQREATLNEGDNAMDTEILPPPPPLISSTTNSDYLADGIATPRLSLVAINRLRVKSEFSVPTGTPQHYNEESLSMPEDFINEDHERESGEVTSSISDEASDNEAIPNDFFDDLLCDKLEQRIENAKNSELEEKYSDRLKELKRLRKIQEKSKDKHKNRKKQKKTKKKSRKRSRSRSLSPISEGNFGEFATISDHNKTKRSRIPTFSDEMPSTSTNYAMVDTAVKIKSEFPASDFENKDKDCTTFVENVEEIGEILTPKQKRERAITRASILLNHLKEASSNNNNTILSTFPFVSTVRKLPTSHSYVEQQIYENRSPLHTVNNVSYKFNSHITRFNMEEWGLAALPTHAAKLAKLVGCDAQFIHNKLKTIKIPPKLKKIKQEPTNNEEEKEQEELVETSSSLYCNAMTQTDDGSEFDMLRKNKGYEIGVQVEPSVYSIGCQTLETQSPTEDLHKDDGAPIMRIIRDLNENQLMAIHQFAELIKEPNANANAMEMYKIQMQILDIYKISQIPSALGTAQKIQVMNNYITNATNSPPQSREGRYKQIEHAREQLPTIQSVCGADGTQFSVNDPRAKSAAYARRIVDGAGSSSNYDSRYSSFSRPAHGRPSSSEGYEKSSHSRSSGSEGRHYFGNASSTTRHRQHPLNNQAPPATTKFFGRGGARR